MRVVGLPLAGEVVLLRFLRVVTRFPLFLLRLAANLELDNPEINRG